MLLTEVALVRAHGAHTEQGAGILTISEPLVMDACMLRHVRRVQEEMRCLVASRCTGVGKQKNCPNIAGKQVHFPRKFLLSFKSFQDSCLIFI